MARTSIGRACRLALVLATLVVASALTGIGASAAGAAATTFTTHNPAISGKTTVGHTLSISMSTWTPKPTTKSYQWFAGGSNIPGATASTYKLTAVDLGKSISVRVTGSRAGFANATASSLPKTISAGTFTASPKPSITGSAKVGATLTASPGTWTPTPTSAHFQWSHAGTPITDATSKSYAVQPGDTGKALTVTVTAALTGYTTTSTTSPKTSSVSASLVITKDGTHKVGGTHGVAPGTYVTTGAPKYCSWTRLSGFLGLPVEILASNFGAGQEIVTVLSTDAGFVTNSCGTWIRLSDAPSVAKSSFKDGVYAVGQNIEPGTYTASKPKDCYWATLSGFDSYYSDIIDKSSGEKSVVDLTAAAVGFQTTQCGTWTRTGD